jgi:hypothetical protein
MSARDRRRIRYGSAVFAVVAGALIAAALTNGVGNTLATVLIGGGLLAIVIFLMRDMGLLNAGDPPAPATPERPSNGGDPQHGPGAGNGSDPVDPGSPAGRRSVNVRPPERMRGQRRRLH